SPPTGRRASRSRPPDRRTPGRGHRTAASRAPSEPASRPTPARTARTQRPKPDDGAGSSSWTLPTIRGRQARPPDCTSGVEAPPGPAASRLHRPRAMLHDPPVTGEPNPNDELIRRLYTAFASHDGPAMAACYAPDAHFSDPVFVDLR